METWYRKRLGDEAAALRIQKMFSPMFTASGRPPAMAVFSRHDREAKETTAYFSPRASRLAALFDATPCEKPPGDGIGLLVGAARSWEIFFPERKRRAA